MSYINNQ